MQPQNISFSGIPVAKYNVSKGATKPFDIMIYELEAKDTVFLKKLKKAAKEKTLISEDIRREKIYHNKNVYIDFCYTLIKDSVRDLHNLFKLSKNFKLKDPSIKYLAVVDKKPCGILVGNIPKIHPNMTKITYSTRNKPRETELDWLITWRPNGHEDNKHIGKVLLSEYYNTISNFKTKDNIYVRSSVPEIANAVEFYTKNGFKSTGKNFIEYEHQSRPRDLTFITSNRQYKNCSYPVVPLEIGTTEAKEVFNSTKNLFERQKLSSESVDLSEVLSV